jgi:hypothetical protein
MTVLGPACAGAMMMARPDSAINTMVELQFRLSQQQDLAPASSGSAPAR